MQSVQRYVHLGATTKTPNDTSQRSQNPTKTNRSEVQAEESRPREAQSPTRRAHENAQRTRVQPPSQKTNEMPLVGKLTPSYAFTTHGRSLQLKVTIFQQFLLRAGRRGCESAQHCTSNWSHIPANAYDFDLSY